MTRVASFHLPSHWSLLCFGPRGRGNSLHSRVMVLSEANSQAKEDVGIGWREPGQKGFVHLTRLKGAGKESTHSADPQERGAIGATPVFWVSPGL